MRSGTSIDRDLLVHLPVVVMVAKHRGFSAAAAALNMSASAVSHAVRAVEDRLGEALFARTTRSVSLTEVGAEFLGRVEAALDDLGAATEGLTAQRGQVTGTLRINASRVAFRMALAHIVARMASAHPQLCVELHTNDALVDIVEGRFDAGVRLGDAVQQDMVTVRLTPPFEAVLVASPAYLRAKGRPRSLQDLARHNCIGVRLLAAGSLYEWDLMQDGKAVQVQTQGTAVITDGTLVRDLALADVGIGYIFEPQVREDLRAGRLERLLPEASWPEEGLFLYFPRRASMSPKLRVFIDMARLCAEEAPAGITPTHRLPRGGALHNPPPRPGRRGR